MVSIRQNVVASRCINEQVASQLHEILRMPRASYETTQLRRGTYKFKITRYHTHNNRRTPKKKKKKRTKINKKKGVL